MGRQGPGSGPLEMSIGCWQRRCPSSYPVSPASAVLDFLEERESRGNAGAAGVIQVQQVHSQPEIQVLSGG